MEKLHKLVFKIIRLSPKLFSIIGIKDLQPDEFDERDDVMGQEEPRFDWKILQDNGDWEEIFNQTDQEIQNWMDCTGHGMKNILQMLYWKKWGIKIKLSAAYINGMAGTSRYYGNSVKAVLESVRNNGWVTDEEWPEENRWKIIPQEIIDKGRNRLKEYTFGYDVVAGTKKALDYAAKFCPLYGGGHAWTKKGMFYVSAGNANHCFSKIVSNAAVNKGGDSYDPFVKLLSPDYQYYFARRVYLEKKTAGFNMEKIKECRNAGVEYIIRAEKNGEFNKITENGLEYIPQITSIADEVAQRLKLSPENVNEMIKFLTQSGKLKWVTENEYYKFLV